MTEQKIEIEDLRKLIPRKAEIHVQRKKGQTGEWFLEIEVKIKPPLSLKEHEAMVKKIIAFYGEDLIEVYTEETGHWFYVYLEMSKTFPTTVIL
jgi:hypothetical protein